MSSNNQIRANWAVPECRNSSLPFHLSSSHWVLFANLACRSLQDETHRDLLWILPAVLWPGCGLRGVRVPVEQQVARRFCLGRLVASVQLAPRPDGDGSGGGVWQRWVAFQIKLMSFISVSQFSSSSKQSGCIRVITHPRLGIEVVYNFRHDFSSEVTWGNVCSDCLATAPLHCCSKQ